MADLSIPGFVDLQVNGFVGVNFSSPDLTEAAFREACHTLLLRGTAAFLPTLITSPVEVYERNLPMIARLIDSDEFRGRLLGIHLEGPFISDQPGAVGAHEPAYVRAPDPVLLEQLLDWAGGAVRLLTVAAELPGIEDVVRVAMDRGVTVSVGHSLFTPDDLNRLGRIGAGGLTHLGNGLPNMLPRHRNPIWAGLAADDYTALIITDGHHLPPTVIRTMARAKGGDRLVVVSDASPVAGMPPGTYDVLGNRAVLEPSGRLYNPEKACLVGSTATMISCMNVLASLDEFVPAELLRIGFDNPLRMLGLGPEVVWRGGETQVSFENGAFRLVHRTTAEDE
jgi:N-acetylglucosamine-6-phosphate deacetylase